MIERSKAYLRKHFPLVAALETAQPPARLPRAGRQETAPGMKALLLFLKMLPWACGLMFVLAFFPPFDTDYRSELAVLGQPFSLEFNGILRTIAVAGLIGFGTNYLAIKMLFRPLKRHPIWGQGLIPGQRDRIIYRLAEGMHTHILSQELIRKRVEETGLVTRLNDLMMEGSINLLRDEDLRTELKTAFHTAITAYASRKDVREEIHQIIDNQLQDRLDKGIKKFVLQTYKRYNKAEYEGAIDQLVAEIPKVAMQVIDKAEDQVDRLAAYLRKEKRATAERIMEIFVKLLNNIDITDLLAKQMAYLDERKLEKMIWDATNEQLLYIQYLGTLLGMLGGLLIWQPVITGGGFLLIFGFLYGLDVALMRWKKT